MVVVLLGILLAATIPFSLKFLTRLRIENFATQISSLIQSTRGRAIRDNVDRAVEWGKIHGTGTDDAISGFVGVGSATTAPVILSLEESGLIADQTAECFDIDDDGTADRILGPLTYDATGIAGTGATTSFAAFCFRDPSGNALQVTIDTPSGPPKIRKLLKSGEWAEERWKWEWY